MIILVLILKTELHDTFCLKRGLLALLLWVFGVLVFPSCKKDKLITDASAKLSFDTDSVLFDTVFTTIGSATRNFKVYNTSNQRIKISDIRLEMGNASPFIINVDGLKGKVFTDVEIAAKDSMYVFLQVNVNPTNANSPIIISDNIVFTTNGNTQKINLEAWGQDAYYYYPNRALKFSNGEFLPYSIISSQNNTVVTWTNDKPHVIYGWLAIDSTQTLVMNAGTRVFLHKNAGIWVYRYGTIKVNGNKGNEVTFQGTRREADYADEPGQWDRIWINQGSTNNVINYAIIKNAFIGLQPEITPDFSAGGATLNIVPSRLSLTNTRIQNCSLYGLYCSAYDVVAGNNLVVNCKENCLRIELGGSYSFRHCTFANYWSKKGTRETPCVSVSNNIGGTSVFDLDSLYFGSCIVDGKLTDELKLDLSTSNPSRLPKYTFVNSLLKTPSAINGIANYTNNINTNPGFADTDAYNFELPSSFGFTFSNTESVNDAAKFPTDLKGKTRNSPHSPGAYVKNQ